MGWFKRNGIRKPYWLLCAVRVLLVFVPQTGYIHPDEYFQTVEVLAGKIFEFESSLPWEFNVTSPIRSIGVPYFTIGFSYKIMQTIDFFLKIGLGFTIITPYSLLICPRLFLCGLSFLVDYSLYKICITNSEKYKSRLLVLSSSYVIIVYVTHTFTNSIEVILFSLLLYYISDSMIFSNIIVRQREYLNKRYYKTKNPAERAKFHKLRLFLASHSFRNAFQISTLTVLGFFNRPTFLCFALFPVFFWLYRGIGYKSVMSLEFHSRILVLIISSIPTILFLIIIDSFFYGYISWGEIGMLDVSINSFVFPPLNFIKYNINSKNLAQHGLHPRYLHILVNIPLLFNILGIVAMFGIMDIARKLLKRKYNLLPSVRSIKGLMTASFLAPTIFLSIFPHQEPRFLLPVILPLIYLYANEVYKEPDYGLMKTTKESLKKEILEPKIINKNSNWLLKLWLGLNLICIVYFGFLQQGGVFPATSYLSKEINSKPHFNYHVVTSHIYSIPHVFLMQPDSDKIFYQNKSKYQISKRIFTYEKGSKNISELLGDVKHIFSIADIRRRRYKLLLLISGSLEDELEFLVETREYSHIRLNKIATFFGHVSAEAMPDFTELLHIIGIADVKSLEVSKVFHCILKIFKGFSLNLYEISLAESQVIT